MRQIFGNIINYIDGSNKRDFNQEDILRTHGIYRYFDWNNTVIGGSYALKQFSGDLWESNDIDIFILTASEKEFEEYIERFCNETLATKSDPNYRSKVTGSGSEIFHELIGGSCKVNHPNIDKILQFVWIKKTGNRPIQSILAQTTDVPSCVSYKFDIDSNQKIFNIPEKGRQSLFWRTARVDEVCPSRKSHYEKRGYYYQ